jgi:hypothetical protein
MALGGAILATRQDAVVAFGGRVGTVLASVCMVAPHSEQAGTCKRASFQYKVIHIPQGDSYRTAAPPDGPGGTYKDASRSTTCVWGGHKHFHFLTAFP